MPLKVLYAYIHGLLPHQLIHPSIHTTFRLTYEKHETSKGLCGTCSKSREETLSSLLNDFEQDPFYSLKN